jgi:hypothetical protein
MLVLLVATAKILVVEVHLFCAKLNFLPNLLMDPISYRVTLHKAGTTCQGQNLLKEQTRQQTSPYVGRDNEEVAFR